MKKRMKRLAGLILVTVLLITCAGTAAAPAYAGGPDEIRWQPSDTWLWPDDIAYLSIYLYNDADYVNLQYYSSYYGGWTWFAPCNKTVETDSKIWETKIDPAIWEDDSIKLRFEISADGGSHTFYSDEFMVFWTEEADFQRVYGSNRYQTAISIADLVLLIRSGATGKYPNVIIACGTNFADALGGAYLADMKSAPILLVNDNPGVIQDVCGEIQKNMYEEGMIYILGGEGAVSSEVESALKAGGFKDWQIKRFAGANRYETNLQILDYCGVSGGEILICSGTNFADALSASAVGLPIMLAGKELNKDQMDFLNGMKPEHIMMIGGDGAVSKEVEEQVKPLTPGLPGRLNGVNRYETSKLVANWYFSGKQRYYATLAYGRNFPDGLAGGPLALTTEGPLLLVTDDNWQYADLALSARNLGSRFLFVLGGPTFISDETIWKILERDESPDGPVGGPEL